MDTQEIEQILLAKIIVSNKLIDDILYQEEELIKQHELFIDDDVQNIKQEMEHVDEVKKEGNEIPRGQRGMLQAIVDAWEETGRIGLIVKADHDQKGEYIYLKKCVVKDIYYKGTWREQDEKITVREFLENFYKKNM